MPNCIVCNGFFPSTAYIDGRLVSFKRRKRCFNCSPFNKKAIHLPKDEKGKTLPLTCEECGKDYKYIRNRGHTLKKCAACVRKKVDRRAQIKAKSIEYKNGKCEKCGYNRCIAALEFHHTNEETKLYTIAEAYTMAWDTLRKELDKCELLCSNCHRETTYLTEEEIEALDIRDGRKNSILSY